jgi:hypothetical protein
MKMAFKPQQQTRWTRSVTADFGELRGIRIRDRAVWNVQAIAPADKDYFFPGCLPESGLISRFRPVIIRQVRGLGMLPLPSARAAPVQTA